MAVISRAQRNTPSDKDSKPAVAKDGSPSKPRIVEASAKLTSKNQTTIPTSVRAALGLEPLDRIKFQVLNDGRVELTKDTSQKEEFDPMVLAFLDFIEADIIANPQMLSVLQDDPELRELLKDVKLDENIS